MLVPVIRPTKIVNISGSTNDVNLFTQTGNVGVVAASISYPHNLYCFVTATVGATANTTPAFKIGTGYHGGTDIYIKNSSTITGGTGGNGSTGTPGATGGVIRGVWGTLPFDTTGMLHRTNLHQIQSRLGRSCGESFRSIFYWLRRCRYFPWAKTRRYRRPAVSTTIPSLTRCLRRPK